MTDPIRERHPGDHLCIGSVGGAIYDPGTPCDAIRAADERDAARADADRLYKALNECICTCIDTDGECIRGAALRAHEEATR